MPIQLTLRAGCWIKFCTQLAEVVCPYTYYHLFYHPFYRQVQLSNPSTPQALFQIAIISLWIL